MTWSHFTPHALSAPVPPCTSPQFAVAPSATAQVPLNVTVAAAVERTQAEIFAAVTTLGTVQTWLQTSLPPIEDGNNFGVSIVMEGIKVVTDTKKALADELKVLPDYFKERAAAAEKLGPKESASSSESTSTSADKETKGAEAETASAKSGTSSGSKKDVSSSTPCPDAVAHITAVDVNWFLRLYATLDRVRTAYAVVADFLEKNEKRISQPKGSGSGMSMF